MQNLFNLADQRSVDVLTECEARNIAVVPFCPLGWPGEVRRRLLADPVLAVQAARLGATLVQVALAWLLDGRPEHPAHPRDPHPGPPSREPRRR